MCIACHHVCTEHIFLYVLPLPNWKYVIRLERHSTAIYFLVVSCLWSYKLINGFFQWACTCYQFHVILYFKRENIEGHFSAFCTDSLKYPWATLILLLVSLILRIYNSNLIGVFSYANVCTYRCYHSKSCNPYQPFLELYFYLRFISWLKCYLHSTFSCIILFPVKVEGMSRRKGEPTFSSTSMKTCDKWSTRLLKSCGASKWVCKVWIFAHTFGGRGEW